ncbi:MAG: hypothetical protein ABI721_00385 [Candidatus Dojkabacteria bacterium]
MKVFINFLLGIAFIIAIGILAYVAFIRSADYLKIAQDTYSLEVQKTKNDAIDGCFKSATVTNTANGVTRTEPSTYLYQLCLEDKGLEVSSVQ